MGCCVLVNQAPEYTIQHSVGWSQVRVNWKSCGKKVVWHKVLRCNVGFCHSHLCGSSKTATDCTVRGESGRVQQPTSLAH